MAMQKLKTVDVKGKKFQVSVNDEGSFFADYENEQISAESLKKLTEKLSDRIKRSKRVSIPFCMWEKHSWNDKPGRLRTGVILGIHGSNNNLLVKFDDEQKSEQLGYGDFFDPKDSAELKRLCAALNDAENRFENFKKKHEIDGREKVREALELTGENDAA